MIPTPAARSLAIRILLNRPASTRALLDAIDKGTVRLADLALDQKQALALPGTVRVRCLPYE